MQPTWNKNPPIKVDAFKCKWLDFGMCRSDCRRYLAHIAAPERRVCVYEDGNGMYLTKLIEDMPRMSIEKMRLVACVYSNWRFGNEHSD